MITFAELVAGGVVQINGVSAFKFSNASHATINGKGGVLATSGVLSGGVNTRDDLATIDGLGALTATGHTLWGAHAGIAAVGLLRQGGGALVSMAPLSVFASNKIYASSATAFLPLTVSAHDPLVTAGYAIAAPLLSAMTVVAHCWTGEIGQSSTFLPALVGQSSDHPYAAASVYLQPLTTRAHDAYTAFGWFMTSYQLWADRMTIYTDSNAVSDELLAYSDDFVPERDLSVAFAELLSLSDVMLGGLDLSVEMAEILGILDGLLQSGKKIIWVYNTDNKTNSMYDGWEFTSMGAWNGRYFGATSDGLYELGGSDDAGQPIVSSVLTGKIDFGSGMLTRLAYVYVGMSSEEAVDLVVHTDDGTTNTYHIPASAVMHNRRAVIGKGLRARYWQFEVTNADGGAFDIESMEYMPDETKRRI